MNQTEFEKYKKYLPGMTKDCSKEFLKLARIIQEQVLDIWKGEDQNYYAAFVMNDSVESFLIFEDAVMTGVFEKDITEETTAALSVEEESYVLAVRQGNRNSFTLRFRELAFRIQTYQYHEVVHVWVKGEEHLRQLVYQLGIIKDKAEFLPRDCCSRKERQLIKLLEFAPLRGWYFVPWEEDSVFESTDAGIDAFLEFADLANDDILKRQVLKYQRCSKGRQRQRRRLEKRIHCMLNQSEHLPVYELLREELDEASKVYEKRSFGAAKDHIIEQKRIEIAELFEENGFHGIYPWFYKTEEKINISCRIYEEQPFVNGGTSQYRFYYFWSETEQNQKKDRAFHINEGFFQGAGRVNKIQAEDISWENLKYDMIKTVNKI